MRGRTNIGGGGIAINATVEQKTIKSGNIIAGDFVEYYSEAQYLDQSESNNFVFNFKGFAVSYKQNGIALFKNNQQISYYSDYNITTFCKYNDFIVFISEAVAIGVLSVNENTGAMTLVSSIPTDLSGIYAIGAGGGRIVAYKGEYSSRTSACTFVVCDIANDGTLSNLQKSTRIVCESGSDSKFSSSIVFYDGDFYQILAPNGWATIATQLYKINFDENGIPSGNVSVASALYYSRPGKILYQNNKIVIVEDQYSSTSGGTESYRGVIFINLESKNMYLTLEGETALAYIDQDYLITYRYANSKRWLRLYHLNVSLANFTLLYEDDPGDYYYGFGYVLNGDIAIGFDESSNIKKIRFFKIINDEIQSPPNISFVIPYSGDGNPIGVAKDTGTTNDVIDVYIPVASS